MATTMIARRASAAPTHASPAGSAAESCLWARRRSHHLAPAIPSTVAAEAPIKNRLDPSQACWGVLPHPCDGQCHGRKHAE